MEKGYNAPGKLWAIILGILYILGGLTSCGIISLQLLAVVLSPNSDAVSNVLFTFLPWFLLCMPVIGVLLLRQGKSNLRNANILIRFLFLLNILSIFSSLFYTDWKIIICPTGLLLLLIPSMLYLSSSRAKASFNQNTEIV
jgi:hypothetical protein